MFVCCFVDCLLVCCLLFFCVVASLFVVLLFLWLFLFVYLFVVFDVVVAAFVIHVGVCASIVITVLCVCFFTGGLVHVASHPNHIHRYCSARDAGLRSQDF